MLEKKLKNPVRNLVSNGTREIVKLPHRVLRIKAAEVPLAEITSPKIQKLISGMKETLATTADGVGLAAPQVGEPLRLFIISEEVEEINLREKLKEPPEEKKENAAKEKRNWKYYVFINPLVKNAAKKKQEGPEGCLSVPGKYGLVKRSEKITVEAYDESGKKFLRGASRFLARVIQHELDHLEGVLFTDRTKKFLEAKKPLNQAR